MRGYITEYERRTMEVITICNSNTGQCETSTVGRRATCYDDSTRQGPSWNIDEPIYGNHSSQFFKRNQKPSSQEVNMVLMMMMMMIHPITLVIELSITSNYLLSTISFCLMVPWFWFDSLLPSTFYHLICLTVVFYIQNIFGTRRNSICMKSLNQNKLLISDNCQIRSRLLRFARFSTPISFLFFFSSFCLHIS